MSEDSYADGELEDHPNCHYGGVPHRADLDGRAIVTYFYYEPQMASRESWKPGPTGIANKMLPPSAYFGHA
eukprot:902432-Pyramimonas_sp.AAC.1